MLYGHFIEHFHRQIYGGIYDPGNPLSDKDGLRLDVIEAMRRIKIPVLRWPGGCYVSAAHWKDGVGTKRTAHFDKAWRVEEPNTFGTDEYIKFCRKVGCEPYICTNAGTGTAEEMSDWVEYCNLKTWGQWAKQRIQNGNAAPYNVKYWSIGNENYLDGEIGAKSAAEWGRLVTESAKMMKRVDPSIELSAAALADLDWNINLLKNCGDKLSWISLHGYWDGIWQTNDYGNYGACMVYTNTIDAQVKKVRGTLAALGLDHIRIAFDEWNLRGWHHPNVDKGLGPDDYLAPRDLNDENRRYTMADAVFTACFLNMLNRNCDIIGMANYAPVVNTRGCIFTHPEGIVLRSTFHVFEMYSTALGETVLDTFGEEVPLFSTQDKQGGNAETPALDLVTTLNKSGEVVIGAVNKDPGKTHTLRIDWRGSSLDAAPVGYSIHTLSGKSTESYNDIGHDQAIPEKPVESAYKAGDLISLAPHSVNLIRFINQKY
ncbi:MAG: alpha-N-arabinofuranosidase [Treponema sp.]|jgi:alpha-N-arabinofuranosidase|nr:alpha-N-arabinofuranosidase [Treponema sp.]